MTRKTRHLFTPEALSRLKARRDMNTLQRARQNKTGEFREKPRAAPIPLTPIESLRARVKNFQDKAPHAQRFTVDDVLRKFGMHPRCYLTGAQMSWWEPKSYQLDHFVPVAKGGSGEFDNLRVCTPAANKMKDGHLFETFVALCRSVSERHQ